MGTLGGSDLGGVAGHGALGLSRAAHTNMSMCLLGRTVQLPGGQRASALLSPLHGAWHKPWRNPLSVWLYPAPTTRGVPVCSSAPVRVGTHWGPCQQPESF